MKISCSNFFEKHLGPSWPVKLWGFLTAGVGWIAINPEKLEFLGEMIQNWVVGACKALVGIFAAIMAGNVKSSQVTGGSVPANKEAADRVQEESNIEKLDAGMDALDELEYIDKLDFKADEPTEFTTPYIEPAEDNFPPFIILDDEKIA